MSEQGIFNFATIGEVFEDGVSLIFDGQKEATEKHYKVNTSIVFRAGDRVKVLADSGTYVVEYVVGLPKQDGEQDGEQDDEQDGEQAGGIELPAGGTAGQALIKGSSADNDIKWGVPDTARGIRNMQYQNLAIYDIKFKTDSSGNFYIMTVNNNTWKKITVE